MTTPTCAKCASPHEPHTLSLGTCTVCVRYDNVVRNGTKARRSGTAPGVEMTRSEFAAWFATQPRRCHYCTVPEAQLGALGLKTTIGLPLQRLGLDRVDSTAPYEVSNVVLCCYACNTVKSNVFSYDEMLVLGKTLKRLWKARLAR